MVKALTGVHNAFLGPPTCIESDQVQPANQMRRSTSPLHVVPSIQTSPPEVWSSRPVMPSGAHSAAVSHQLTSRSVPLSLQDSSPVDPPLPRPTAAAPDPFPRAPSPRSPVVLAHQFDADLKTFPDRIALNSLHGVCFSFYPPGFAPANRLDCMEMMEGDLGAIKQPIESKHTRVVFLDASSVDHRHAHLAALVQHMKNPVYHGVECFDAAVLETIRSMTASVWLRLDAMQRAQVLRPHFLWSASLS